MLHKKSAYFKTLLLLLIYILFLKIIIVEKVIMHKK